MDVSSPSGVCRGGKSDELFISKQKGGGNVMGGGGKSTSWVYHMKMVRKLFKTNGLRCRRLLSFKKKVQATSAYAIFSSQERKARGSEAGGTRASHHQGRRPKDEIKKMVRKGPG